MTTDHQYKTAIPIYFGCLYVIFSDDFNATVKRFGIDTAGKNLNNCGAFAYGRHTKDGIPEYFLVFDKSPDHNLVAHEIVHIVNWIFKFSNMVLDLDNDEPQAYLTGWVTNVVYKALYKFNQ